MQLLHIKVEINMKDFEMTQDQLDAIMNASQPVPMIALQCGTPSSAQERANNAWRDLGNKMGFYSKTVRPNGKGDRFFSAEENCQGIEIGDGNFSGCDQSAGDCPECGK